MTESPIVILLLYHVFAKVGITLWKTGKNNTKVVDKRWMERGEWKNTKR